MFGHATRVAWLSVVMSDELATGDVTAAADHAQFANQAGQDLARIEPQKKGYQIPAIPHLHSEVPMPVPTPSSDGAYSQVKLAPSSSPSVKRRIVALLGFLVITVLVLVVGAISFLKIRNHLRGAVEG